MSVHECTCGTCYLTEAKQLYCERTHNVAELKQRNDICDDFADRLSIALATNDSLRADLARVTAELDEASPMRTCARCGKGFRSHLMVWEEGDEQECLPCNHRWNAMEAANVR